MNSMHSQLGWDLLLERQKDMIKEAEREHLARMAHIGQRPKANWFSNLFRGKEQNPAIALNQSASPELG